MRILVGDHGPRLTTRRVEIENSVYCNGRFHTLSGNAGGADPI